MLTPGARGGGDAVVEDAQRAAHEVGAVVARRSTPSAWASRAGPGAQVAVAPRRRAGARASSSTPSTGAAGPEQHRACAPRVGPATTFMHQCMP